VVLGGIGTLVSVALARRAFPELARIDRLDLIRAAPASQSSAGSDPVRAPR